MTRVGKDSLTRFAVYFVALLLVPRLVDNSARGAE